MTDEEITAYHESGHAVMAFALGGLVQSISLTPESSFDWDDDVPRHGDTIIAWPTRGISPREHAEREIKTALAGPVCEMIHTGDAWEPGGHQESAADWHAALQHAMQCNADPEKRSAYLASVLRGLERFFDDANHWAAVGALADELLAHETLATESVHGILGFWMARR